MKPSDKADIGRMKTPLDCFARAYVECALWSSTDFDGTPLDELHDALEIDSSHMVAECEVWFYVLQESIQCEGAPLGEYWDGSTDEMRKASMAGHDFCLTRNGHGAGFWDGKWPEPQATTLTRAAMAVGEFDIMGVLK